MPATGPWAGAGSQAAGSGERGERPRIDFVAAAGDSTRAGWTLLSLSSPDRPPPRHQTTTPTHFFLKLRFRSLPCHPPTV